jgi:hypothetical protein
MSTVFIGLSPAISPPNLHEPITRTNQGWVARLGLPRNHPENVENRTQEIDRDAERRVWMGGMVRDDREHEIGITKRSREKLGSPAARASWKP